jgi:hypothetical protein
MLNWIWFGLATLTLCLGPESRVFGYLDFSGDRFLLSYAGFKVENLDALPSNHLEDGR